MRKTVKILHTVSGSGLIGGLGAYMLLLVFAPQGTPEEYADLRTIIVVLSTYLLLPSLALALITGLLSMVVHYPFREQGWAWVKAVTGILLFEGVLAIIGAKATYAAEVSRKIAEGTAAPNALHSLIQLEWGTLWVVMAITLVNVALGVWRPRLFAPRVETNVTAEKPSSERETA